MTNAVSGMEGSLWIYTADTPASMVKLGELSDLKLKIDGKEIDTSNVDDAGWGSSITGARSWEMTAGAFYYNGAIPLEVMVTKYLWKFYSVLPTVPFAIGWGMLRNMENMVANPNDAQKQNVTVKGSGELYVE